MKEKFSVEEIEKFINENRNIEKVEYGKKEYKKAEKLGEGEKVIGIFKEYREIEGKYGKTIILILDTISIFFPIRAKRFIEEKITNGEKIEIIRGKDEILQGKRGKYIKSVYYILKSEGKKIICYKI